MPGHFFLTKNDKRNNQIFPAWQASCIAVVNLLFEIGF